MTTNEKTDVEKHIDRVHAELEASRRMTPWQRLRADVEWTVVLGLAAILVGLASGVGLAAFLARLGWRLAGMVLS